MGHPGFSSRFRIGVLGGGQLGKMLIQPAHAWNLNVSILDPDPDAPARKLCPTFHHGSFREYDTVLSFGREVDLLTIEIEHVNVDALLQLQAEGKTIHPDPGRLRTIKDKGLQKQFLADHGLPTAAFGCFDDADALRAAVASGARPLPFVQKLRAGGYDGRGVQVVNTPEDLDRLLEGPCLAEDRIPFVKEVAVIAARNPSGETRCFPAVELEFHPEANLVEMLLCPATLPDGIEDAAQALALRTIEAFGLCGVLAVEMFLDEAGRLYVNEVAPRPHNSGHHTIETAITSQYEQHLRAILDLPLGSTRLKSCAAMINLLGAEGHTGEPVYAGIEACLRLEGSHIHIYGKRETRPFRKMGHATLVSDTLAGARAKAEQVKQTLRVIA